MTDILNVTLAQPCVRTGNLNEDIDNLFDGTPQLECDILVLPELIGANEPTNNYQSAISSLANRLNCYVVGGSHYIPLDRGLVNSGVVADHRGRIVTRYEKVRPYGSEIGRGIVGGSTFGRFSVLGREFAVLICSDLWFSDSFTQLDTHPDGILIPSFSITQKQDPRSARQLWQHMTISRAYEYTSYVGVSDWAYACKFDGLSAAGVTGFANPRPNGDCFYEANESEKLKTYELNFSRLDAFRENRAVRGFLWNPTRKRNDA